MTATTNNTRMPAALRSIPTPAQIKEYLDKYVIGQEEAKKTLSVAVYNHYRRLQLVKGKQVNPRDFGKSNVLMLGNTGCGKTHLVKTIARMLNVPCYIQDCTKITASGYVGSDVEDCLAGLLRTCNYDMEAAQMGIVMLDEVDKIRKAEAGPSVTRDVSGECVQQSLLKIVEGDIVGVPPMGGRKHPEQSLLYVDTSNILFIASGAFVGLEDIIAKRSCKDSHRIGFAGGTSREEQKSGLLSRLMPEDLHKFGMIPEFVGRFPVNTYVSPLEKADLVRILTEPDDAIIGQYKKLLEMDNIDLEFTPDALDSIADLAIRMSTGARGLRGVLEKVMRDIMFNAPSMKGRSGKHKAITITADTVRSNARVLLDAV